MPEAHCSVCGAYVMLRSVLELEGECPENGCEEGSLRELDAYDDPDIRELVCKACGWTVEANVDVTWDEERRQVFTVDDDCPVCATAGDIGNPLQPNDGTTVTARERPELRMARAAAKRLRETTVGSAVPVDVEAIARALSLQVRRSDFNHDGLLHESIIEVPKGHPGAERFVIAHEIGHAELRHQGGRVKIEPEANAFASELLIPEQALRERLRTPQTISALARHFGASRQAVVYAVSGARLVNKLR